MGLSDKKDKGLKKLISWFPHWSLSSEEPLKGFAGLETSFSHFTILRRRRMEYMGLEWVKRKFLSFSKNERMVGRGGESSPKKSGNERRESSLRIPNRWVEWLSINQSFEAAANKKKHGRSSPPSAHFLPLFLNNTDFC